MKRAGFKPKAPPPRPVKTLETYTPKPRAVAVAVADTRARMVVTVPKPEKAKPGKRTPTAEERAWMDAISAIGCIACLIDGHPGTPADVHHILRAGQRIGHMHTIPLCPGHHRDGTGAPGLIARHPYKARFESRYGTESELLARSRALVNSTTTRREPETA